MKQKICFSIMGFGKKTDFSTSKQYDLDKTYDNIIKPAVESCGYLSIRADEILDSGLIDKSMYALLIKADLVIADITTLNPNALYELGIRHGSRPNATIILKDEDGKIPFDLDHNRFIIYKHLGDDVGVTEAKSCIARLTAIISNIERTSQTDSPLFEYISGLKPHTLPDDEYESLIKYLSDNGERIFALTTRAKKEMAAGNFRDAAALWKRASQKAPDEHYFIQQHALSVYKSAHPSLAASLQEALAIISTIYSNGETNDPETLGLYGSIQKQLFETNNDIPTLKIAIDSYKKGYLLTDDFYTGENYATCLEKLSEVSTDQDEKIACRYIAKETRNKIISILEEKLLVGVEDEEMKWIYATLANCHFHLHNKEIGNKFEILFYEQNPKKWEIQSYLKHKPITE